MTHKPKTLADIQIQRKALKRKLEETEAIIAEQFDLGSEKLLPKLDLKLTNLPYIAEFLSLIKRLSWLENQTKPSQLDKADREALWTALLKVALPLLIGLLTKRFSK